MRYGLFLSAQHPAETDPRRALAEHLEQVGFVREHGFHSIFAGQHFLSAPYQMLQPVPLLARVAAAADGLMVGAGILLLPLLNPVEVAENVATLDHITHGRLTLGVSIGYREKELQSAGVTRKDRVPKMTESIELMKRLWAGEERGYAGAIGPPPAQDGGPPLVIGGMGEHAVRRAVELGDGWTMGGGTPDQFKEGSEKVKAAWSEAGRDGDPRLIALCYYTLGDGAREAADSDLRHYYAWLGDVAEQIAQSAAVSREMTQQYRDAFAQAGADELIYFPCSTDPAQVDLLAEAVL